MGCCDPIGSDLPKNSECPDCEQSLDVNGDPLDVCQYADPKEECKTCGSNRCDQDC